MSHSAQAELARSYKDNYSRGKLIRRLKESQSWTDAELVAAWRQTGRPNSEYWQWVEELS